MRYVFFIVVLVAAAFLGGAFINGPGLEWAKTRALRYIGLTTGAEIDSVDLKQAGGESNVDEAGLIKPERDTPVAPTPSVVSETEPGQEDASERRQKTAVSTPPRTATARAVEPPPLEPPGTPAQPLNPSLEIAQSPAPERSSRATPPASPNSNTPAQSESPRPDPNVKPALLDALAGLLPANRPSSNNAPSPQQGAVDRKTPLGDNEEWVIVERKMQSLGVSRYTCEGEPGGRVVFSCLIPLAGRQAVTQRFEAEGDDLIQAARAALRRIALWRTTQLAP